MQVNMEQLELWDLVEGTAPLRDIPTDGASPEAIQTAITYNDRAHEARLYIVSHMGDEPYSNIIYKSSTQLSAKVIWANVRSCYQEKGDVLRYELLKSLTEAKWDSTNPIEDHVEQFSRNMKRLNDVTSANGLDVIPEWTQIAMLLQSIDGVRENIQRSIVDVLKGANLKKKSFVEIAGDLKSNGHIKTMLELWKMEGRDEDKMMGGWVDAKA
jgi:hypothetical protein